MSLLSSSSYWHRKVRQYCSRRQFPNRKTKIHLSLEPLENRCLLSASGSISGTVFEDLTGNGVSSDDPFFADRSVMLYMDDGDGVFYPGSDELIGQQPSSNTGNYHFNQLAAGTYFVQQEVPIGWVQTEPDDHGHEDAVIPPSPALPLPAERNDTISTAVATGLSSAVPGTYFAQGVIGDNKKVAPVLDVDMFRIQADAGDMIHVDIDAVAFGSTLDGIVRIFDASGKQVAANDDAVGDNEDPHLDFVVKSTGTYYVGVSGFANGGYNPFVAGSGGLANSTGAYTIEIEVGPRGGAEPIMVTLADNEQVAGIDLAASRLGSITGQMFHDLDGDGVHDPDEPGQDGEFVILTHQGVTISFTPTHSIDLDGNGSIDPVTESGWYTFEDLPPGVYFTRTLLAFGVGTEFRVQTTPTPEFSKPELIGDVPEGEVIDPGVPGLIPDLTVELEHGLADWFITGNTLHFGQSTPNIGLGPMELRAGPALGDGTQIVYQRIYNEPELLTFTDYEAGKFIFHPEHNHIHFDDYAVFTLYNTLPDADGDGMPEVGAPVTVGLKTSFCLVDVAPYDLTLPNADPDGSGFGCGEVQRISVGWMDVYGPLTSGQQIDISGLPQGQYWLEAVVDPDNHLIESNETNNVGRVLITIDDGVASAPAGAHGVTLSSGQTATGADFGNFDLITISGHVFNDRKDIGRLDSNDKELERWIVFIDLNGDGVLNNPEGNGIPSALASEPWTFTDKQGNYAFTGVGPGMHIIRVVGRDGWVQTTPNPEPIEARSGQNITGVNFGFFDTTAKKSELEWSLEELLAYSWLWAAAAED